MPLFSLKRQHTANLQRHAGCAAKHGASASSSEDPHPRCGSKQQRQRASRHPNFAAEQKRNRQRAGSAGKQQPQQRHKQARGSVSIDSWLQDVRANCSENAHTAPQVVVSIAAQLARVPHREVAAHCSEVRTALAASVSKASHLDTLKPYIFLAAVTDALQQHEALAIEVQQRPIGGLADLVHRAAGMDEVYSNVRAMSQVAVAQQRLGVHVPKYWNRLLWESLPALNGQGCANALHAYATLYADARCTTPQPNICNALAVAAGRLADSMVEQNVANGVWALGKLGMRAGAPGVRQLLAAAPRVLPVMTAQGVSNMLLGCAYMQARPSGNVQRALHAALLRTHHAMKPQDIANSWWALSELTDKLQPQVQWALLDAAARTASSMDAQHTANTLLALARFRLRPTGELRQSLLTALQRVAPQCNSQDLANAVWALGVLQLAPPAATWLALNQRMAMVLAEFPAQGCSNAVFAFAALLAGTGWRPPTGVLQKIWKQAELRFDSMLRLEQTQVLS